MAEMEMLAELGFDLDSDSGREEEDDFEPSDLDGSEEDDFEPPSKKKKTPPKAPKAAKAEPKPKKAPAPKKEKASPAKKPAAPRKKKADTAATAASSDTPSTPASTAASVTATSTSASASAFTPAPARAPAVRAAPAAASAASKKGTVSEADADGVILDYMIAQNRPFSNKNVFDNLHGSVKKTTLDRVMDKLVDEGKLQAKAYGKSKIYYPPQDQYEEVSQEQLAAMDERSKQIRDEKQALATQVTELEARLKSMRTALSTEQLIVEVARLRESNARKQARLTAITSSGVVVTPGQREALAKQMGTAKKVWKERKEIVTDMLDAISEGLGQTVVELMEQMGIQNDQSAGVDIKTIVA